MNTAVFRIAGALKKLDEKLEELFAEPEPWTDAENELVLDLLLEKDQLRQTLREVL